MTTASAISAPWLFAGLFLASSLGTGFGTANAIANETTIQSDEIRLAAQTLVPPTGSYYEAQGRLNCWSYIREWAPHTLEQGCEITIAEKMTSFKPSRDLLKQLMSALPTQGPVFQISASFKVIAISQEVPPYKIDTETYISVQ